MTTTSNKVTEQIVRTIDLLIGFEIERKFGYFMNEPKRVETAVITATC